MVTRTDRVGTDGSARDVPVQAMLNAGPEHSALRDLVRAPAALAYVYAGLDSLGERERDLRWRRIVDELVRAGAPEPAVTTLATVIGATKEAPDTLAVFVDPDGAVVHEQRLASTRVPDRAGLAAPPPILPLLAWRQDRPPYVLVVTDRTGADFTASRGGDEPARTWRVAGPDDEIERNAPGGWSQPRYQRRAEDSWRHNAERVAEETTAALAEHGAQVLVLSGDVRALQLLSERLPDEPRVLVRHITGGRSPDGSQSGRGVQVEEVLRDAAQAQTVSLLEYFQTHLDPGEHAVEGSAATIDALAAGRVAALLVVPAEGDPRTAWFGTGATDVFRDDASARESGELVRAGNLVDVAVRAALLSGAHVRVVPPDAPGRPAEGIGAVCRFGAH